MKKTILVLFLGACAAMLYAEDAAVFENLGFSENGRYFMFGQHVLLTNAGQAYADLAVVDVPGNVFVPNGRKLGRWDVAMQPGQSSLGGLLELLEDSIDLSNKYNIRHLEMGRPLYLRLDGEGEEGDSLDFRDFEMRKQFELSLNQEVTGTSESASSSFGISLKVTNHRGQVKTYNVGRPNHQRKGVLSYRVDRVWMGPDGKGMVIALAMIHADLSVRYMIETLRLTD